VCRPADHIGRPTFYCSVEYRARITQFCVRSVEIGRAQDGGAHSVALIGRQDQIFLLLAHLAFEGDGISRMGFVNQVRLRKAVGINGLRWTNV
jgi:hypothetical protein